MQEHFFNFTVTTEDHISPGDITRALNSLADNQPGVDNLETEHIRTTEVRKNFNFGVGSHFHNKTTGQDYIVILDNSGSWNLYSLENGNMYYGQNYQSALTLFNKLITDDTANWTMTRAIQTGMPLHYFPLS